ncbi:MerC domain-containing protein [Aliidiomarina celeris]|uniref:MerC domain-containing protein n=1 Tax=Aliidiomarina celeris TaxID=2249428 RepID=UPI000DE838EF|nr:MerC domain-containing protein [Aliidiomarina celeris]
MQHKPLDKAGIVMAVLCALHCLLVPVVLPTLGLMGLSFLGFEWFERLVLTVGLIIGALAISSGIRHHGSPFPLIALSLGGVLYFFKDALGHHFEPLLIVVGASLLVTAHVLNLHLCRTRNRLPCEEVERSVELVTESVDPAPQK